MNTNMVRDITREYTREWWLKLRVGYYYFVLDFVYTARWYHVTARLCNRWLRSEHPLKSAAVLRLRQEGYAITYDIRWCGVCGKLVAYELLEANRHRHPANMISQSAHNECYNDWLYEDEIRW